MNNNELYHYGVLGMKWGVRRTPEQLGHHVIPKGTKMYRATVNDKESINGSKYVTYLKVDRDHYRGTYADELRSNSGKSRSDNLYEKTYKLKENLHVPSRVELEQVHRKVMSDKKTREKIFKAYFDIAVRDDIDLWEDPNLTEKSTKKVTNNVQAKATKRYDKWSNVSYRQWKRDARNGIEW